MDNKNILGDLLTVIYVAILICVVIVRWPEVCQMELNQLGDALAGAVGPLAFIWLVRGYIQQGEELRINTEALRLQTDELKAAVKQQELLVETNRATLLAAERPILAVSGSSPSGIGEYKGALTVSLEFQLHNGGRTHAMKVRVFARAVVAENDIELQLQWEKLAGERGPMSAGEPLGFVVAPNATKQVLKGLLLDRAQTVRAKEFAEKNGGRWPRVCVLGLVFYDSIMASEHVTAFGYSIKTRGQDNREIHTIVGMRYPDVVLIELPWIAGPTT